MSGPFTSTRSNRAGDQVDSGRRATGFRFDRQWMVVAPTEAFSVNGHTRFWPGRTRIESDHLILELPVDPSRSRRRRADGDERSVTVWNDRCGP